MDSKVSEPFSSQERERYSRHLLLPKVGEAGQIRLKNSKVLCVGAGGLGSPTLLYLAGAGVGRIGIIDPDRVDRSNLQRQVLFGENSLGELKVEAAKKRLLDLNPDIKIDTYSFALSEENVFEILKNYDLVIDGTDNFSTKYLINDACVSLKIVNIQSSLFQFEGQCTVFAPGGPCYRCLYPLPPSQELVPNCAEAGVLGVLPGIMGVIQATETLKYLLGIGESLVGRLILFDSLSMSFREIRIPKNKECQACEKQTPFHLLSRPSTVCASNESSVNGISVASLKNLMGTSQNFCLVDVRNKDEYERFNLGGYLISLPQLSERLHEIDRFKNSSTPIIVCCETGGRSLKAVQILKQLEFENVYNLVGGLEEWKRLLN